MHVCVGKKKKKTRQQLLRCSFLIEGKFIKFFRSFRSNKGGNGAAKKRYSKGEGLCFF